MFSQLSLQWSCSLQLPQIGILQVAEMGTRTCNNQSKHNGQLPWWEQKQKQNTFPSLQYDTDSVSDIPSVHLPGIEPLSSAWMKSLSLQHLPGVQFQNLSSRSVSSEVVVQHSLQGPIQNKGNTRVGVPIDHDATKPLANAAPTNFCLQMGTTWSAQQVWRIKLLSIWDELELWSKHIHMDYQLHLQGQNMGGENRVFHCCFCSCWIQ